MSALYALGLLIVGGKAERKRENYDNKNTAKLFSTIHLGLLDACLLLCLCLHVFTTTDNFAQLQSFQTFLFSGKCDEVGICVIK